MHYYKEIKNGEIFSYQQHLNPVDSAFLEEISEDEYNQAIRSFTDEDETVVSELE